MPALVETKSKMVRLYYVGNLNATQKEGRTVNSGVGRKVTAGGRSIELPPLGQSLEIEQYIADELISRHTYSTPSGMVSAFTTDKRLAFQLMNGISPSKAVLRTVLDPSQLTDEELAEEIARRAEAKEPMKAAKRGTAKVKTEAAVGSHPSKTRAKRAPKKPVDSQPPTQAAN